MAISRISILCIGADSDEDAWEKMPDQIDLGNCYVLDTEEE